MGLYCFQNISISYLLQCNSQLEEECLYGLVACIAFRTSLYLTCCSVTANGKKNVCMGLYCFQNISISYLLQCNSHLEEESLYGLVLLSEHLYILPVAV